MAAPVVAPSIRVCWSWAVCPFGRGSAAFEAASGGENLSPEFHLPNRMPRPATRRRVDHVDACCRVSVCSRSRSVGWCVWCLVGARPPAAGSPLREVGSASSFSFVCVSRRSKSHALMRRDPTPARWLVTPRCPVVCRSDLFVVWSRIGLVQCAPHTRRGSGRLSSESTGGLNTHVRHEGEGGRREKEE